MFIAHDPNRQQLTRLQMHDQFSFIKENNHLKSQLNYCMLVDTSLVAERKDHQYVFYFPQVWCNFIQAHDWGLSRRMCLQHNYDHRLQ